MNEEIDMSQYVLAPALKTTSCAGCEFYKKGSGCEQPDADCMANGGDYIFIKKEQP